MDNKLNEKPTRSVSVWLWKALCNMLIQISHKATAHDLHHIHILKPFCENFFLHGWGHH